MGELPIEWRKRNLDKVRKADEGEGKVDEENGQDGDVQTSEFGLGDALAYASSPLFIHSLSSKPPVVKETT